MKFFKLDQINLNPTVRHLIECYWQWRSLWIVTTASFCALGLLYAVLLKSDTWVASQGLIVRDEATGTAMRLGRFESQTQMKAAQETVLEMARNPLVIEAALTKVGRRPRFFGLIQDDSPPTRSEVEDFARSSVSIRAPRGAELGTTEVIYLDVKQNSKERAIQLASAICDALEQHLRSVRVERATGVMQELQAARDVCETSLQEVTLELQKIEVEAGSDLADLRGLSDSTVGSTNRLMLDMVRDEQRKADLSIKNMMPNVKLAEAAIENPDLLMQAVQVLAESHPVIDSLRVELSDAIIKSSRLRGRFNDTHPEVINSRKVELAIRENLVEELRLVVAGYEASISVAMQKSESLRQQEIELGKRLNRLAELRGQYSNLLADVKSRGEKLSQVKNDLIEAIASRDAALASSLITRLDKPTLSDKPIGPGRTTIVGGATVGGLMFGLSVVFLLVPLEAVANTGATTSNVTTYRRTRTSRSYQVQPDSLHAKPDANPITTATATATPNPAPSSNCSVAVHEQSNAVPNAEPSNVCSIGTPPLAPSTIPQSAPQNEVAVPEVQHAAEVLAFIKNVQGSSTSPAVSSPTVQQPVNPTAIKNLPESTAGSRPEVGNIEPSNDSVAEVKPRRAESIEDVRKLISSALKCHSSGENA